MPSPSQSDLHINAPLTNVSIAYIQGTDQYIADKVFPKVNVAKQSDLYWKYSKSDWRKTDVERRAPSTESKGTGWKTTTDSYFCHVYAVHKDIDDQLRANADSNFNLDSDATKFITNQMLLKRDIDWMATYFKTGVWGTNYVGTTDFVKWSDTASNPVQDVNTWVMNFREINGFAPNFMVVAPQVMNALKANKDILDRIRYVQKGVITEDLIASLLGVGKIYVAWASKATDATDTTPPIPAVPELNDVEAQDAAAGYKFLTTSEAASAAVSKGALIGYAPSSPSLLTPSAGYTFTWSGYQGGNGNGIKVSTFRQDLIKSDRIEAEMTYDQKLVASDMGIFLSDVI
jgi:hypothetical protein